VQRRKQRRSWGGRSKKKSKKEIESRTISNGVQRKRGGIVKYKGTERVNKTELWTGQILKKCQSGKKPWGKNPWPNNSAWAYKNGKGRGDLSWPEEESSSQRRALGVGKIDKKVGCVLDWGYNTWENGWVGGLQDRCMLPHGF